MLVSSVQWSESATCIHISPPFSHVRPFVTPWLLHTRPPCPSPPPRAYSNSCPLSQWCHPTISSSVLPFSSCLQSFPASGSFPRSQFFIMWPKYWSFNFRLSPSNVYSGLISFRMDWFDLLEVQETANITTGKTIAFTRQTFVGKVISLFYNMLCRLAITFLPRPSVF